MKDIKRHIATCCSDSACFKVTNSATWSEGHANFGQLASRSGFIAMNSRAMRRKVSCRCTQPSHENRQAIPSTLCFCTLRTGRFAKLPCFGDKARKIYVQHRIVEAEQGLFMFKKTDVIIGAWFIPKPCSILIDRLALMWQRRC